MRRTSFEQNIRPHASNAADGVECLALHVPRIEQQQWMPHQIADLDRPATERIAGSVSRNVNICHQRTLLEMIEAGRDRLIHDNAKMDFTPFHRHERRVAEAFDQPHLHLGKANTVAMQKVCKDIVDHLRGSRDTKDAPVRAT